MPLPRSGQSVREGLRRTFASLSIRNYRRYYTGRLISASGTSLAGVAETWWLAEHTRSGLWLAFYAAAFAIPAVLGGAWAGVLADRVSKRRLLLVAELGLMLNETMLWCLSGGDMIRAWVILAGASSWSIVNTVASPARDSFVRDLVDTDRVRSAVAMNGLGTYAASIVGAGAAGPVIVHWGVTIAWSASALSSGALVLALATLHPAGLQTVAPVPRAPRQLRDALAFARRDPALWLPLCSVTLIGALALNLGTLVPLLATETHTHAGGYGALQAGIAVGCAAGALFTGALRHLAPAVFLLVGGFLGASEALATASSGLIWQVTALAAAGLLSGVLLAAMAAHVQLRAPTEMLGRISALSGVGQAGASLVGGFGSGWLAEQWSARGVLLIGGLAASAVAVTASLSSALACARAYVRATESSDATPDDTSFRSRWRHHG